ncbi:MAG: hypothetical protein E6J42_07875 [Chloroflexi bacterium]|nr:MAG: hypothetical protein E6J42_07875 [Chloroflexota bacterium]
MPAVDVIVLADDVAGVEAEVEGESCGIPSGTAREGGLDRLAGGGEDGASPPDTKPPYRPDVK